MNTLLLQLKSFTGTHYFCLLLILRKTLRRKTARQSSYKPSGLLGWPSGRCSCWDQGPLGASPRWKGHINKMLCLTEKNQENKQEENSQVESTQIKYIFFMRLLAEQQRQKQRSKEEIAHKQHNHANDLKFICRTYMNPKHFLCTWQYKPEQMFLFSFPHFVYRDNVQKANFVSLLLLQSDMSSYTIKWGTHKQLSLSQSETAYVNTATADSFKLNLFIIREKRNI